MYAIIRTGGHQEKVTVGETITVDHLKQDPESEIRFTPLMISADDGTVVSDRKALETDAAVVGRVLKHVRGDKIDVFQYRQKTGYRRHIGHRSMLTLVEIAEIRLGDKRMTLDDVKVESDKAAEERAVSLKAAAEARDKAKAERAERKAQKKTKTAPAGKPAAAPKKKAAARKPAAKKAAAPKKKAAAEEE
ncbi:MAG: 50S ribosomal protein L21 [Actinomycetota bacterium]